MAGQRGEPGNDQTIAHRHKARHDGARGRGEYFCSMGFLWDDFWQSNGQWVVVAAAVVAYAAVAGAGAAAVGGVGAGAAAYAAAAGVVAALVVAVAVVPVLAAGDYSVIDCIKN